MKIKTLIFFLFLVCHFNAWGQSGTYKKDTVTILKVEDKKLLSILDSLMIFEQNCEYYTSNLKFNIHIQLIKKGKLITLSSMSGLSTLGSEHVFGCFFLNGYYG